MVFSHMAHRDQYVLPGGGIDPGETYQACAERECREELGLLITSSEPLAMVREYYNGILRYENLYVLGTFHGERTSCKRTEEEILMGLTEQWISLDHVQETLLHTNAHLMEGERQPEYVRRAIANCHMRELLGISAVLGWDSAPAVASRCTIHGISVKIDRI